MKVYRGITLLVTVVSVLTATAQNDVQLSQHMFNRLHYNPAVTGASRYININALVRDQWAGWEGAPHTQMLTVHNYFNSIHSGFGLVFLRDEIGFEETLNVKIAYAYHVKFSAVSYLSLGVSGGVLHRYFDRGKMQAEIPDDQGLLAELEKKTIADFDFGIEYNRPHFTVGASVTHLAHTAAEGSSLVSDRHYYAFVRYIFPLSFHWEAEPSFFIQSTHEFVHPEVSCIFRYDRRFWLGVSYRTDRFFHSESCVPMAGLQLTPFFRLGYSYDINLGKLKEYSEGTHELILSVRLRKLPVRYSKSPRFFE